MILIGPKSHSEHGFEGSRPQDPWFGVEQLCGGCQGLSRETVCELCPYSGGVMLGWQNTGGPLFQNVFQDTFNKEK